MSASKLTHSANGIKVFDLPAIEGRPHDPPRKVALTYTPTSWGIVDVLTGVNVEPYAINWPVEEPISRSEDGHEGIYLSVSQEGDEIDVSAGLSALFVQFLGAYAKYTGLKELLLSEGILRETEETHTIVKEHPTGILPGWVFELPKVYITLKPSEVTRQCFPCQTAEGFGKEDKRFLACGGCHSEYYCSKKVRRTWNPVVSPAC